MTIYHSYLKSMLRSIKVGIEARITDGREWPWELFCFSVFSLLVTELSKMSPRSLPNVTSLLANMLLAHPRCHLLPSLFWLLFDKNICFQLLRCAMVIHFMTIPCSVLWVLLFDIVPFLALRFLKVVRDFLTPTISW